MLYSNAVEVLINCQRTTYQGDDTWHTVTHGQVRLGRISKPPRTNDELILNLRSSLWTVLGMSFSTDAERSLIHDKKKRRGSHLLANLDIMMIWVQRHQIYSYYP